MKHSPISELIGWFAILLCLLGVIAPNAASAQDVTAAAAPIPCAVCFDPASGHYYQWVSAPAITWQEAQTEATSATYSGIQGYLATVTSDEEYDFINNVVFSAANFPNGIPANVYIGGSDSGAPGTWRWVTGPEGAANHGEGLTFYSNDAVQNNLIAPWDYHDSQEQIDGTTGEYYLYLNSWYEPGFAVNFGTAINSIVAGGNSGYLIEYSNVLAGPVLSGIIKGEVTSHVTGACSESGYASICPSGSAGCSCLIISGTIRGGFAGNGTATLNLTLDGGSATNNAKLTCRPSFGTATLVTTIGPNGIAKTESLNLSTTLCDTLDGAKILGGFGVAGTPPPSPAANGWGIAEGTEIGTQVELRLTGPIVQ